MSETFEVVATGAAADAIRAQVPTLVQESFAGRLFAKDATLWGPDAEAESAKRLSWVSLPQTSRPLVGEVAALRDELAEAGVDHVVLCGMGGSSLAPEVICATEAFGPCPPTPGMSYPRATQVRMLPLPRQRSMPDPCDDVPANRWCDEDD